VFQSKKLFWGEFWKSKRPLFEVLQVFYLTQALWPWALSRVYNRVFSSGFFRFFSVSTLRRSAARSRCYPRQVLLPPDWSHRRKHQDQTDKSLYDNLLIDRYGECEVLSSFAFGSNFGSGTPCWRKAQYSWPPCINYNTILWIIFFTKETTLMRTTVLSFPFLSVFLFGSF